MRHLTQKGKSMTTEERIGFAALIIAVGAFLYLPISGLRDDVRSLHEASLEHSKALGTLGGKVEGLALGFRLHGHRDGNVFVVPTGNETGEAVDLLEYLDDVPKNLGRAAEHAVEDTVEAAGDAGEAVVERARDVGRFIRDLF